MGDMGHSRESFSSAASAAPSFHGKKVLLVCTGSSGRVPLMEAMVETGVKLVVLDSERKAFAEHVASDWIVCPMSDRDACIAAAHDYVKKNGAFDGVLSYDDFEITLAAEIAASMDLPHTPAKTICSIRNKYEFRQRCRAAGVPSPRVIRLPLSLVSKVTCTSEYCEGCEGTAAGVVAAAVIDNLVTQAGLSYPMVLKPSFGAGKINTRRVDRGSEVVRSLCNIRDGLDAFVKRWGVPREEAADVFLEEYLMGGPEVDVDCVVMKGRVLFASINQNRDCKEPFFLECGGMVPPEISEESQAAFYKLLQDVLDVYGEDISSVCHFEAKMTHAGPAPIELNLRIGGAETPTMMRTAYGVNFAHEALRLVLSSPADCFAALQHRTGLLAHCSSTNIVPDWEGEGVIESLVVDPRLRTDPAFAGIHLYFKQGDLMRCPPAGSAYMGWLVAKGETHEAAESGLVRLMSMIQYKLVLPPAKI